MQPSLDYADAVVPVGMASSRVSSRMPLSWITLAAIVVSLFALLPLGFVIVVAFQSGWETVSALVFRPRVGELLVNTLLLAVFTVPIFIVL
jgi:iron(III) transport system permease protein